MNRLHCFTVALVAVAGTGCVDLANNSYVHFTMGGGVDSPCQVIAKYQISSAPVACTGDRAQDRFLYHYELWAAVRRSGAVKLASFTVQRHLLPDPDPNLKPTGYKDPVPYEIVRLENERVLLANGQPFKLGYERYFNELSDDEQKELIERIELTAPMLSVTSFSTRMYSDQANKVLDPSFHLGSASQQTRPFNGLYFGQVNSGHPFAPAVLIGGGELKTGPALEELDSMWVTIENGAPDRAQPRPSPLVYLSGTAVERTRGTINVDAVSPYDPTVKATFAVHPNLANEEYF